MSRLSWYQRIYWSHLAKPATERALYKYLVQHPVTSVLEVGVGDGHRMRRIAKLARAPGGVAVRYIGTDEFESASDGRRHLTLKQAHQAATQLGLKASLIPGDVAAAVPRVAHKLGASDLLIINQGLDPAQPQQSLLSGWLNRLAHPDSTVFASAEPGQPLHLFDLRQLETSQANTAA